MNTTEFEIEDLEIEVAPGGTAEPVIWIIGVMIAVA